MYIPVRNLWWLAASGGAGYTARYLRARINFALAENRRRRTPDPTGGLLRLHELYGYSPHSFVGIAPGAEVWTTPDIDGAIIYSEFGRVWLAAGDPLAAPDETAELARQFAAVAKRKGRVAAFVPVSARFARLVSPGDFTAAKVGAVPYFDLQTWNPRGDSAKKMRAGVNQARRAGVEVQEISGEVNDSVKHETALLCSHWLESRRAGTSFSWLVALDPFLNSEYKKYFAARVNGKLAGFLVATPISARKGWYLEDVLREPDAPQGTATLLVAEALTRLKAEGALLATLGTAPLATEGEDDVTTGEHPMVDRALRGTARRFSRVYNFEGLRRFKSKFAPSYWESEYALSQRGVTIPPRVGHAVVRALVPGGLTQLLTRQALRVVRENASARGSLVQLENVTREIVSSSKLTSRK
jgi:phosphatidylglycerol lysyltransferase